MNKMVPTDLDVYLLLFAQWWMNAFFSTFHASLNWVIFNRQAEKPKNGTSTTSNAVYFMVILVLWYYQDTYHYSGITGIHNIDFEGIQMDNDGILIAYLFNVIK